MDPNVALSQLRMLAAIASTAAEFAPAETAAQITLVKFAEVFEGLDEWLKKGGALPAAWQTK